jgi:formylglycine-generating enzyme required for sulfatase activity
VHRDLKPENIMVTLEGSLRILDLGVARRVAIPEPDDGTHDHASISLGFGVGTPGYMAPEQWCQSDIDGRADIFAIGVIAYELVTEHAPFRGRTHLEIRERTLRGEIDFEADCWQRVPVELKEAVRVALACDRRERFTCVDGMVEALGSLFPPSLPPLSTPRPSSAPMSSASTISRGSLAINAANVVSGAPSKLRARWFAVAGVAAALLGAALALHGRAPVPAHSARGMVLFAGASYSMGLEPQQLEGECKSLPRGCPPHARNETPPRPITVGPFELDVREVTNEEFARFLNQIGSHTTVTEDYEEHYPRFVRYIPRPEENYLLYDLYPFQAGIERAASRNFSARSEFENLPVTLVTWLGAHLYCKSTGKRLPTEGEWEWAAKGREARPFPWGSAPPRCGGVHIPSNKELSLLDPAQCENQRVTPFAVMTAIQDVTPEGIHDMGGNVFEWVDDDALLHDETATDATRASVEKPGINRGGAYDESFTARTTGRAFWLANTPAFNVGFRCAKSSTNKRRSFL